METLLKFESIARLRNMLSMLEFLTPDCVTDMDFNQRWLKVTREGYNNFVAEYEMHKSVIVIHYEDLPVTFEQLPEIDDLRELSNKRIAIKQINPLTFKFVGQNFMGNVEISIYRLERFVQLCRAFKYDVCRV